MEKPFPPGVLGVECIQTIIEVLGYLCITTTCINSFSFLQVSSGTCHKSIQTSHSSGTMLDGGSLASHSSQDVGRCSSSVSHHNRSHQRCFDRLGAQGSAITAFNPFGAQMCIAQTRVPFVSLSVCGGDDSSIYNKHLPVVLERSGMLVHLKGCTKQCHFFPSISLFLFHLFGLGLAWHTIGIYHSAVSALLELHHHHKASNHPIISKLMHKFYLQCPSSHKWFDQWDVKHLLTLLESWDPGSSLLLNFFGRLLVF